MPLVEGTSRIIGIFKYSVQHAILAVSNTSRRPSPLALFHKQPTMHNPQVQRRILFVICLFGGIQLPNLPEMDERS